MKSQDDFLIAHIDHERARFTHAGEDLGIEFKNQIDAWMKMEIHFRHQLKNPGKRARKAEQDLNPYVYSFRERLE